MTQSIIVYRNPVEAAIWEGDAGALLVPSMVAGVVLAVVAVTVYNKLVPRGRHADIVAIVAALVGVASTYVLL